MESHILLNNPPLFDIEFPRAHSTHARWICLRKCHTAMEELTQQHIYHICVLIPATYIMSYHLSSFRKLMILIMMLIGENKPNIAFKTDWPQILCARKCTLKKQTNTKSFVWVVHALWVFVGRNCDWHWTLWTTVRIELLREASTF